MIFYTGTIVEDSDEYCYAMATEVSNANHMAAPL